MDGLVLDFLRHLRPSVSSTTYRQKCWQLRSFRKYLYKRDKNFSEVRQNDIEVFLKSMGHCAPATRRDRIMTVRDFYDYAAQKEPLEYGFENPVKRIMFYRYKKRSAPLVPGETAIKALLNDLSTGSGEMQARNRAMAELSYGSGLRLCEIMALDVEDVDREKAEAYLAGKGGKTRIVPLTAKAVAAVWEYLELRKTMRGPLFLSNRGRRLRPVSVGYVYRNKIGMRSHLLRHACATHLLKNGCGIRFIQELLGHKYLTTTQVYTHIIPVDVERAVQRFHPRTSEIL